MTDMTKNLDSIPYDVFYQVASTLDCHDFIHLSRVNRALSNLTRSESIARKTLEDNLLHTKEGQKADRTKSGYRKAVGRLFDIKEAVATAQPYSASILAFGSAFLYSGGSLSYIYEDEIRALDVHGASQVEHVLNIHCVLARAIPNCNLMHDTTRVSLMYYSHGVLAFLVEMVERQEAWLLAVDMRRRIDCGKTGRLRLRTRLQSTKRLFVRHNQSYLFYGTHSALGYHGYPQWAISCVDLTTGQHLTDKPVELENFAGYEIGQTVCFEVHEDHLYAVSTLVDFEEEEVDWTSYYVWICLPPGHDSCSPATTRTWRRQHREGPINDTWSDLSLRHDEATKRLMILECRREWLDGGSDNCRTYYMQPLPSPSEIPQGKQQGCASRNPVPLPDEPLAKTLDPLSKPNYERPHKRLRRYYHAEYPLNCDKTQRRDFILAKTKFRTYNHSASTFVDLVNDPYPDPERSLLSRDRLRLRVVSRKRKSPIDEEGEEGPRKRLFRPEVTDADGHPVEHSEERFITRGVQMWPPDNAPQELNDLLCPSRRIGKVQAIADERSIVYSVEHNSTGSGDNRAIVLINFDPSLRLPGLQRLGGTNSLRSQESTAAVDIERPHISDLRQESPIIHATVGKRRTNQAVPSVREEPAMYLSIRRGYWLR
ncbi:F-box domain protein [Aspergillus ambiguus]|uniref:F-box domain protein n=1 Tax=Aspergillus ambiguus TaxID=176160 RepID=UPI003CCD24FF